MPAAPPLSQVSPPSHVSGRYSLGPGLASEPAEVSLTDEAIIFTRAAGARQAWPFPSLATTEPLTPAAIDALVSSSEAPGAILFVANPAFARTLLERAPHLSAKAHARRHARFWFALVAAVIAVLLALWASGASPAHAIATVLPERARQALGEQAISSMTSGHRVCETPSGRAAIDHLALRLAKGTRGIPFHIEVVDWSVMNAFAVPGEHIVVTRGLIAKAEGPDELAGVLAHEMGHGLERHPETAIVRAIGLSAGLQLLFGGTSGATLGNIGLWLAELSNTRAAEHEADLHALALLEAAGISAKGFAQFFTRVLAEEGETPAPLTILRTHPPTEARKRLAEHAPAYPATPSLSAEDWSALRSMCETAGTQPVSGDPT